MHRMPQRSSPPQGLKLDSANSFPPSHLVNVASHEVPSLKRVKPGRSGQLVIWYKKIEGPRIGPQASMRARRNAPLSAEPDRL
jgi:hypothetical protein